MKDKKIIIYMLERLYEEKKYIEQKVPAGDCHWRINKAKIDMLQWVIEK